MKRIKLPSAHSLRQNFWNASELVEWIPIDFFNGVLLPSRKQSKKPKVPDITKPVKIYVHSGSGEAFINEGLRLVKTARDAGLKHVPAVVCYSEYGVGLRQDHRAEHERQIKGKKLVGAAKDLHNGMQLTFARPSHVFDELCLLREKELLPFYNHSTQELVFVNEPEQKSEKQMPTAAPRVRGHSPSR